MFPAVGPTLVSQADFAELVDVVIKCRRPYPPYGRFDVCLAKLHGDGRFELLSAAWEATLGFGSRELEGRSLGTLLPLNRRSGRSVLRRMMDPVEPDPLQLDLLRRDGRMQHMHCYRRFDDYEGSLFIACEALPVICRRCRAPSGPGRA
jgi:PAS domain-containing protein